MTRKKQAEPDKGPTLDSMLSLAAYRLLAVAYRFPDQYADMVERSAGIMPSPQLSAAATAIKRAADKDTGRVDLVALSGYISLAANTSQTKAMIAGIQEIAGEAGMAIHEKDPTMVNEWMSRLAEGAERKRLSETLHTLSRVLATEGDVSLEELRSRAMVEVKAHESASGAHDMLDLVEKAMAEVAEWEQGVFTDRIFTGLTRLDATLSFPRGNLSTFGALSGAGKTVFGVQVALHNAIQFAQKQDTPERPCVIFFSAEMTALELLHRMAAHVCELTERYLRRIGQKDEYDIYRSALRYVCNLPIIIDDTVGPDLSYIGAKVAQVAASRDVPLVVFDHTEKAFANGQPAEDQQVLSMVISGFKNIAKANYAHFLTLHQLSRAIVTRDDSYPRVSDLRGSGRLEHECYGIMLLHSELALARHKARMYPTELLTGGYEVIIDVAKHRNGPTGPVRVAFHPDKLKFTDLDNPQPGQQQGPNTPPPSYGDDDDQPTEDEFPI